MGNLIGKASPDYTACPEEVQDRDRRQLKKEGWDGDRAVEFIRKGISEDERGVRQFSPARAKKRGG